MVDYPQINIKLLCEEERQLVERAKERALELRLTFKEFLELSLVTHILHLSG